MFDTISKIFNNADSNQGQGVSWGRFGTIESTVGVVINLVIGLGFSISMVAITISFVMYVLSEGDPDKTKRAWSAFLYGVIGAALSLGIVALKTIVVKAFGINDTNILNVPTNI
ncbi:hypothetical protein ACFLZK_02200 [Patescibacteria group bacterium]